jgi:hypothetical protein
MNESEIQTKFGTYLEEIKPNETIAYELKFIDLSKKKSLPFSRTPLHQKEGLKAVEDAGLYWKIPDMAAMNGFSAENPFDCFYMKGKAYLVPCFYVPYKRKTCYLIRINDYLQMEEEADRKSFTEEMCRNCTESVIEL